MTFSQSLHFSEFQFLYLTEVWVVLNGSCSPVQLQNSFPGHSPLPRIALDSYLVLMLVASVSVSSTSDKVTWFHPIYLYFFPWEPLLRPQTYQKWDFSNGSTPYTFLYLWISLTGFLHLIVFHCHSVYPLLHCKTSLKHNNLKQTIIFLGWKFCESEIRAGTVGMACLSSDVTGASARVAQILEGAGMGL